MDVDEILARVASAHQASPGKSPFLLATDINGIQEFVASASRPIVMKGASLTIKAFDESLRRRKSSVFAGGGRSLHLVASEDAARTLAVELSDRFGVVSHGGVLATGLCPFDREHEGASVRWARMRLDAGKEAASAPVLPTGSVRDRCAYCRARPYCEKTIGRPGETPDRVCSRCYACWEAGREANASDAKRGLSFEAFARDGKVACVAADGCQMGRLFSGLESLVAYALVSEAVGEIFERAHREALPSSKWSYVDPVVGGDDLLVILDPAHLLRYVETLAKTVRRLGQEYAAQIETGAGGAAADQLRHLQLGIGAVVSDHHFPAWRLAQLARELERRAKQRARRSQGSAFDFEVLTSDSLSMAPERNDDGTRPLVLGESPTRARDDFFSALGWARAFNCISGSQRRIAVKPRDDSRVAEWLNLLRYQVARSEEWQAWFAARGQSWRHTENVAEFRPDAGLRELARLLEFEA